MHTTIFTGGCVIRSFPHGTESSARNAAGDSDALAIRNGIIVALGVDAKRLLSDARAHGDEAVIEVDLGGGVLMPAIGEGHAHPILGGLEQLGPQVRDCTSIEAIAHRVQDFAEANPNQKWIVGASYDATLSPGGHFDARWLDVTDRPVVLRAWDYHTVWVNTAALVAAGITASSPEPPLGRIIRRPDGSPLGTLQEQGAIDLISAVCPPHTEEVRVEALARASTHYIREGVTWVQDAWVDMVDLETYLTAAQTGVLTTRFNLALRVDPLQWPAQYNSLIAARERVRELNHPLLTCNTVKFFLDGVVENRTAFMLDSFSDDASNSGLPNWDPEALAQACQALDADGFQLHLHAIGDRANRLALDCAEATRQMNGVRDRRTVIAHVHVLAAEDIARFAELDVIANFEPLWAQSDAVMRDLTLPALGPIRESWQYRIGDLTRSGAHVSFGSDWPVTSSDWRPGVATAVTRQTPDGQPGGGWTPEQRVVADIALAAYTHGVAYQAFADDRHMLAVGQTADAIWLSHDPRVTAPHTLPAIEILGTWLAGKRVH
ncbi:amidohydrolase [Alpinimonas psychrophila]|uniref:Amidohydrolase 3 domain-containing protein n=1 Tax=Alpinimonas psychrophila TaxID=748908 RepID=A0A7W3PPP2_9MICO|nr:amidohydrolase [Alpinimonas psychrophila]MBA8829501.1 hypothetical protein [Alpinimonas psychrophila]